MNKINLLKDNIDYEKTLTNDAVINVIGTKGSGKTTLSSTYLNNDEYVVINCDKLLEIGEFILEEDDVLTQIKNLLKEKNLSLNNEKDFLNCYNEIIDYLLNKDKKVFIEGNALLAINPITNLKGTIIIKRTALLKSYLRAVKRDYQNDYFMEQEKKLHGNCAKVKRLYKVLKRRKSIFNEGKNITTIINELENKKD